MDQIKQALDEEIKQEIQELSKFDAGSEEKAKAIDGVTKLYKLKLDEIEAETKRKESEHEKTLKHAQRKDANIGQWVGIAVQVGLAIGGWICYDIWHRRGLKFEETGTVCSPWTKNLMSNMKPRR